MHPLNASASYWQRGSLLQSHNTPSTEDVIQKHHDHKPNEKGMG